MYDIVKRMPIAISGTLLAIISLGNLLDNHLIKYFTFTLALLIIFTLMLKLIFYRNIVKNELNNPIVLSTSGTFSMAIMLLSTYLSGINHYLSLVVWSIGVILHSLLIVIYTYKYIIKDFNIENYYGSLWIVYIGYTMGAVSGGLINLANFSRIFLIFGFIMMIPSVILVTYRYIKYPVKEDINKPFICIYTAIFNILIVGYLNTFTQINITSALCAYIFACCLYLFSFYQLIKYIRMDFYPSFSAFTFPFVISAMATKKLCFLYPGNMILNSILLIESSIAIMVVCYVFFKYLHHLLINKNIN